MFPKMWMMPICKLNSCRKKKLSQRNDLEQKRWGKHRLPYIPDKRNKLRNSEMLAIVDSSVKIWSWVPQAWRKNAVFLINTKSIKNLDGIKSDSKRHKVNRIKLEDGWNRNSECLQVKVIANKRNILDKNQIYMKINRSENSHELIRNIVYFKDKGDQVVNSKIVLQYYIDRKIGSEKEEVDYIASSHGKKCSFKF